jgi:hypothetical protein
MAKPWDTLTITFSGAVLGLVVGLGNILAARFDMVPAAPVSLAPLLLLIAGSAAVFAIASILRNTIVAWRS